MVTIILFIYKKKIKIIDEDVADYRWRRKKTTATTLLADDASQQCFTYIDRTTATLTWITNALEYDARDTNTRQAA